MNPKHVLPPLTVITCLALLSACQFGVGWPGGTPVPGPVQGADSQTAPLGERPAGSTALAPLPSAPPVSAPPAAGVAPSAPEASVLPSASALPARRSSGGSGGGGSDGANQPPEITLLQPDRIHVAGFGQIVEIDGEASDADDLLTDADFSWSCVEGCSDFSPGTGRKVFWSSPDAEGSYTLRLTVSDGEASDTEELVITVSGGASTIVVNPEASD